MFLWVGFCIIFINQSGQFKSGSAMKRVVVCNIFRNGFEKCFENFFDEKEAYG